jgi:cadmium resistance protein CadD (predicted permease)
MVWDRSWMVRHPVLGPQIQRWGRPLFPAVLIGLGIMVLAESGSLRLLTGGRHSPDKTTT